MNERELNCLLCNEGQAESKIISHIHEHLGYFPYKCRRCDFRSNVFDQLIMHRVEAGHKVSRSAHRNRYSEYLCQKIYEDILKVDREGLAAAEWMSENESDEEISETDKMKNKQSKFQATSSKSYNKQPEISEKTQNRKEIPPQIPEKRAKNVQDAGISSSNSLVTSSTSQNRRPENPELVKVIKKKVSKETMPSLSVLLENIIEQVTKGKQTIKCIQCKEDVANDFRTKEKHVRKSHPNFSIDACFPGSIATSELECAICGKEYRSETGRLNHVAEQHIELYLKCPLCDVQNRIIPKMTDHFKRVHEIHENELPPELSQRWKLQKEEFYARMNVLVKKVFPIKLKEAKNAENIDEPLSSLFEPTVFSSHKAQVQLQAQASNANTSIAESSTSIKQSPIISPPRRTLASALSKIIGGNKEISKEKPKMQLVQAPVNQKRIETESSDDSSDDSLLPGQVTTKKTIVMTKKADNSQEEERKNRLKRMKDWYVRLPSPDSSSIELSSDSESELLARKSAASSKKLTIKSEPKSSSESISESEDEQSEEIAEPDDELNDQVKAETEEEQEQASENFDLEEEDIIKMEEPLIEENAVAISGISDQEVFDHFCVKNQYELFNLPQFRPPDGWSVNGDILDRYKMVCFKFLRKTMLSLSPTNFYVHDLYRVCSLPKLKAYPPLFSLFPMINGMNSCQICGVNEFRNMTSKVVHIFSCEHIVKVCARTKTEPPEILHFFDKFETSSHDYRFLYLPVKLEKYLQHFQVKSEQEFWSLPQLSQNRFFNARLFDQLKGKYIRSLPNTILSLSPNKFSMEVLIYLSEIDLQTAHKIPKLHHFFWVSKKMQICEVCPKFSYNSWFVYMKHILSMDHLKSLYVQGKPEPEQIRQCLLEFDPTCMQEYPYRTKNETPQENRSFLYANFDNRKTISCSNSSFNNRTPNISNGPNQRKRCYSNSSTPTNRRGGKMPRRHMDCRQSK